MANQTIPKEVSNVVIKLGLIKENAEPVFRRISTNSLPFQNLNEATAVNQIKKYAILMLEGFGDPESVDLDEYTVALMYTDTDNDKVLIFTDNDVVAALMEYASTGRVKILAEVNMKKKASFENPSLSSASTQTIIDSAEKTTQVPLPAVDTVDNGPPQDLINSIADLLQSAARMTASASSTQSRKIVDEALKQSSSFTRNVVDKALEQVNKASIIAEDQAKQAQTKAHEVQAAVDEGAKKAVLAAENKVKQATSTVQAKTLEAQCAIGRKAHDVQAAVDEGAKKAMSAAENKVKQATSTVQAKSLEAQIAVNRNVKRAVRNSERMTRKATRDARRAARFLEAVQSTSPDSNEVSQTLTGAYPTSTANRNSEFTFAPEPVVPSVPPPAPERPFIHGRHTCDGCLATPIIGKRFHAVNMPDYDLCETCHSNYTGDARFEEAILDRDLAFQDRWHERRARWNASRRPCGFNVGQRMCRVMASKNQSQENIPPPAPQHAPQDPPMARPESPVKEHDLALKEAIRRSLADITKKETENVADAASVGKESDEVKVETVGETDPEVDGSYEEPEIYVPGLDTNAKEDAALEKDIPVEAKEEEDNPNNGDKDEKSHVSEADPSEPRQESGSNDNVDSLDTPDPKPESEDQIVDISPQNSHFSYTNEAEGEIENFMGATLDKMAEAIDGLNWQLQQDTSAGKEHIESDEDIDEESLDDATEECGGAKIMDGDEVEDDDSQESWHVVSEEEQIARATQTLGSALFNSDMERSHENISTLSNSINTGISSAASVPTSVPSIHSKVSTVQLQYWSSLLEHLHELGFDDDVRNVDILESLNAANIGCDSDDEVTLEQVVNHLMKDCEA